MTKLEEKIDKYLNEAEKSRKLTQSVRNKLNKEINRLLKPTHFQEIPLQDIFDVLEKYGIVPIQEDNKYWSGMLTGGVDDTAQTYIDLAWKDSFSNNRYTEEIKNASLALSYYKMPKTGRYEVIAYIA